ncbi:transposase, IS605 OrfB family, central region, partial [Lactobacillus kefiranofaciens]
RRNLSSWTKGVLNERLEYYCQQYGIDFKDVNPAYTSQYCPNCGRHFIVRFGKHNEKTLCPNCGEMDCNIAASKNILARATDKEITLYTPYKKVKAILDQRIAS